MDEKLWGNYSAYITVEVNWVSKTLELDKHSSRNTQFLQFCDGTTEFFISAGRGFSWKWCIEYESFINEHILTESFTWSYSNSAKWWILTENRGEQRISTPLGDTHITVVINGEITIDLNYHLISFIHISILLINIHENQSNLAPIITWYNQLDHANNLPVLNI